MPTIDLNSNNLTTVKLGSNTVNQIYLGTNEIWSSFVPTDADAAAYVAVVNSIPTVGLSLAEKQAIDNLFLRMKGLDPAYSNFGNNEIWTKRIALYPMVGQSFFAYRYNALYPTFNTQFDGGFLYPVGPGYASIGGGVTIDGIYGLKGNGVNGFFNTNLNARTGHASQLALQNAMVGCVWKDQIVGGRDDFGTYNTVPAWDGNLWLRTKPTPNARIYGYETATSGGTNGGKGHWFILTNTSGRRIYYNKTALTFGTVTTRTNEPDGWFGSIPFLALNLNNMNNYGYQSYVNFSANTCMIAYIMGGISDAMIPAWNDMIEDFCIETGKKTW